MSGTRASFATYEQQADLFLHLLRQNAPDLGPQARILDLGCGRGELVKAFRDRGVLAWGMSLAARLSPLYRTTSRTRVWIQG